MKINRISPSSYNSWDGCQHKYFLEQNLKYTYPPGKAADIGTVTHKVLEDLALIRLRQQEIADGTTDDTKLEIKKDVYIDINNYTIDDLTTVALTSFRKGYFVRKDIDEIKQYIDTAISFRGAQYDPRNREIIAPEKRVKIEIPDSWATLEDSSQFFLSGIVDLVTKVDENTYEIIDWKTGRPADFNTGKAKTYQTCQDDPQLRFYHWAATKLYGEDKNYLVTIFFLKTKDCFTIPFDNDDLPKTEYLLRDRFEEIKACQLPKLNRSYKCTKFCPFGKNTCQGTNFPNMRQETYGGVARMGEPMTICDASNYMIHMYGIDFVEENFGKYSKKDKE